jgi:hypothetical protein
MIEVVLRVERWGHECWVQFRYDNVDVLRCAVLSDDTASHLIMFNAISYEQTSQNSPHITWNKC